MTATARRVPRFAVVEPEPHAPTSARLRSDLEALDAGRSASVARLTQLEAGRAAILLSGDDDAAENHDREIARTRRAIERADLRRPGLVASIAEAEAREREAETSSRQAAATAAVDRATAEVRSRYPKLAAEIRSLLNVWIGACEVAQAAGVPTPDDLLRRRSAAEIEPARSVEETFTIYVDEFGNETSSRFPSGSYGPDPARDPSTGLLPYKTKPGTTGERPFDRVLPYPSRLKTRTVRVEAVRSEAIDLGSLATAVRLPGLGIDDASHWPKAGTDV